jgi:transcriptional regulator with XRE-family HTH domain
MSKKTEFGKSLSNILDIYSSNQSSLARDMGKSRAYVSSICNGTKSVSPNKISEISAILNLKQEDEIKLHRSAAKDQGFKLDLPDDF